MYLREATANDTELIFEWANDNSVRKNAINKEKIAWEDHKRWYKSKVLNSETYIYILEENSENIGQIRFEKIENHYEIDYSIDEKYRGKGYGITIIKEGIRKLFTCVKEHILVRAKVKRENIASFKVFKKCCFSLINKEEHKGEEYLIFSLNENLNTIVVLSEKEWNNRSVNYLKERLSNYNWFAINKKEDFKIEQLELINPEIIFIPHWSYIIPENIFLNYQCVVFHMTDLPYGRGGSPLQNLIIGGYQKTRISALKVVKELDAGPIYLKKELSLLGTAEEIFVRANDIIQDMIYEIVLDDLQPMEQEGDPVLFKRRKPEMSKINEIPEINKLFDHIRMLDAEGYPKAYIENEYFKFEFTRATLKSNETILADVRIIKK